MSPGQYLLESPDADTWAHIATDTPAWLLELWTRLDPRLQWEDIDMRMRNFGQRKVLEHGKFKNSRLNNKTGDYRKAHQMISWRDRLVDTDSKARGSVLAKLSRAQVIANSTRPLLSPTPTITTVAQITGTASSVAQAGTNIVSRRFAVQSNPKKRKSSSPLDDETADEETKTAKRTRTTNELQTSQVPKTASSRGTKRQIDADDDVVNAKRVRYSKDKETKDSPPAASCNHPLHTTKPTTKPKHVLKVREDRRRRVAPKVTSAEILGRPIPYFANSSPLSLHYTFDPRTNSFWANDLMQGTAVETIDQPLVADNQVEFGLDLNEIIEAEHNPPVWQPFYSDPTSWSSEWRSFIVERNTEPILKAHALDAILYKYSFRHPRLKDPLLRALCFYHNG